MAFDWSSWKATINVTNDFERIRKFIVLIQGQRIMVLH